MDKECSVYCDTEVGVKNVFSSFERDICKNSTGFPLDTSPKTVCQSILFTLTWTTIFETLEGNCGARHFA